MKRYDLLVGGGYHMTEQPCGLYVLHQDHAADRAALVAQLEKAERSEAELDEILQAGEAERAALVAQLEAAKAQVRVRDDIIARLRSDLEFRRVENPEIDARSAALRTEQTSRTGGAVKSIDTVAQLAELTRERDEAREGLVKFDRALFEARAEVTRLTEALGSAQRAHHRAEGRANAAEARVRELAEREERNHGN